MELGIKGCNVRVCGLAGYCGGKKALGASQGFDGVSIEGNLYRRGIMLCLGKRGKSFGSFEGQMIVLSYGNVVAT